MTKLLLAAALLAAMLPGAAAFAASPGGADYRLDVGDKLRIKVFEWRSATGDVHEWTALDGDYIVGADGSVDLPLVGGVKASGVSTGQLADAVSAQLQSRLGLTIRPQASVEIVQYRPFYILGDVNKPGEYPYRPGLTVLEAISIGGGRYRISDATAVLTASGDMRVLRLLYNQLLARRARLQAELGDSDAMTLPPELQRLQGDPTVAQLIQREQAMFKAHREAEKSELDALDQLKSLLNGEVASLQAKMKNVDQELGLRKQELNNTTTLVQQGLAIAPREYSMRETELETEGRRLDLDTAALRAKEDIGKADQAMVELRNKTRSQLQAELADVEQKIPETAARIATASTIAGGEGAVTHPGAEAGTDEAPALCLILRRSDGKTEQLRGDESAQVEPGDTIKVLRIGAGGPTPEPEAAATPVPNSSVQASPVPDPPAQDPPAQAAAAHASPTHGSSTLRPGRALTGRAESIVGPAK